MVCNLCVQNASVVCGRTSRKLGRICRSLAVDTAVLQPQFQLGHCRRDALNFSHHRTTPKGVFDMVSLVMPSRLTLTESLHRYRFID